MKTVILACRTIEDELHAAIRSTGADYEVVWLPSGLHNTPERLNGRIAEELSRMEADRVLLAMGFCGNSLGGITAGSFELIVPRVDDCISLLLGGVKRRTELSGALAAYFLTDGWMRGERNLWAEYQYSVEKYGRETADDIAGMMYGHYRTLALVDTGVNPIEPLAETTEIVADTFQMEQRIVPGTLKYLERLLTGPWDGGKFLVIPPGGTIRETDMQLCPE